VEHLLGPRRTAESGDSQDDNCDDGRSQETPLPPLEDRLFPPGKIVHLYKLPPPGDEQDVRARPGSPQHLRSLLAELEMIRARQQDVEIIDAKGREPRAHGLAWEAAVIPTAHWFNEIRISEHMMRDHRRETYQSAIDAVLRGMTGST
jgi:hypothetical protein